MLLGEKSKKVALNLRAISDAASTSSCLASFAWVITHENGGLMQLAVMREENWVF
jgi:hypothetical protein